MCIALRYHKRIIMTGKLSIELKKQLEDMHREPDIVAALTRSVSQMLETYIETSDLYNVQDLENSKDFDAFIESILRPVLALEFKTLLDVVISEAYTQVVQHHENNNW